MALSVSRMKPALLVLRAEELMSYESKVAKHRMRVARFNPEQGRKHPVEPEKSVLLEHLQPDGDVFWVLLEQVVSVLELATTLSISNEGEYYPTLSLAIVHTLQVIARLDHPQPDPQSVKDTEEKKSLLLEDELPAIKSFRLSLQQNISERFVFLSGCHKVNTGFFP